MSDQRRLEDLILTARAIDRRYYDSDGGEITEAEAIKQAATTGCMLTSYSVKLPTPADRSGE